MLTVCRAVADTNISMMRSSLCLVLFSLVLLLALTVAEEQQGEELAESRQLRQAGLAQPERKRKKIQKRRFKKGSKKAGKKGSKKPVRIFRKRTRMATICLRKCNQ